MSKKKINTLGDILTKKRAIDLDTLEWVLKISIEIAREGREGRKIGTMFIVSDSRKTLKKSKCMIYDPLMGHRREKKHISNPDLRETIKELAQLDGAFIVSDDGVIISACRYIDSSSQGISLPLGLGSKHMAAASITKTTNAVAVVVSENSIVRVFDDGELISEILPEDWLLEKFVSRLRGDVSICKDEGLAVVSKN